MTDGGATGETYVYLPAEDAPDGETAGWYSADDGETIINETFKAGEAFFFASDVANVSIQTSGQVNMSKVTFDEVATGFTAVCNPRPVSISIQEIVPVGEEVASWCCYISKMTSGGATGETYVYLPAEDAPDGETAGWYSADDGETFINQNFNAGEGFFFASDVGGVVIEFAEKPL